MTLEEATAQRDAILASLGISRAEFQQRAIQYATGDARIKELSYLENLIAKKTAASTNQASTRSTYAKFRRG